jgi:hypothetical protein
MTIHPVGLIEGRACGQCAKGLENHEWNCTGDCAAAFRVRTIGFCGPAGAGKSTAAEHLMRHWGFQRVRFAGPLKAMMLALGLDLDQVDGERKEEPTPLLCGRTPRQAMQWLGTEWGRQLIGEDFWIAAWQAATQAGHLCRPRQGGDPLIVAEDVRFANEAKAIGDRGGIVVWIQRPGAGSASGHAHASERMDFVPDRIIRNTGDLVVLRSEIDKLAASLRGKDFTRYRAGLGPASASR